MTTGSCSIIYWVKGFWQHQKTVCFTSSNDSWVNPLQDFTFVDCPVPSHRENKTWNHKQVPMYDPHVLLSYLFDDIGLKIDPGVVKKYWDDAAARGCPWALQEPQPEIECRWKFLVMTVYTMNSWTKLMVWFYLYHFGVQSRPGILDSSYGPRSHINLLDLRIYYHYLHGWFGLWIWLITNHSLRVAFVLRCVRLVVTGRGIGFFGKWIDIGIVTPHAPFATRRSLDLMRIAAWTTFNGCQIQTFCDWSGARVNPLILLPNFHVSLLQPCQLHNLNLGLLWTSNGAGVATFAELGYFGNPSESLALCLEAAWDDFSMFKRQEGRQCSQCKFTIKMIFKPSHGAYFSAKGYNSRVLADWLADCSERAWSGNLGGSRIFGAWLQGQPPLLQLSNRNEQLAPLCHALYPG